MSSNRIPRREIAKISVIGTTQMHMRNPMMIAFWSIMFPGLGHLLLSKYMLGFVLFAWELVINQMAHINMGIFHTVLGQFDKAKEVTDIRWFALYIPTYAFAIWNSYQSAVDLNKNYILAAREDAKIQPFTIGSFGLNYLDKGSPWVAAFWSLLVPGAGQLIINRIIVGVFILATFTIQIYLSGFLPAVHATLLCRFDEAVSIVEWKWLLNLPSIYFFAFYDAYVNTVESNKLFDWEQAKFLKRDYQSKNFILPFSWAQKRGGSMYIASTFMHSVSLESAITAVQMKGVAKEDILAIPLDKRNEEKRLFDTLHSSDDLSLISFPSVLGSLLSILGIIYGYVLPLGPIAWGLIGMCVGFGVGLLIKLYMTRRHNDKTKGLEEPEVILIVSCSAYQKDMVKDLLWANSAMGVSQLSLDDEKASR